MGYQATIKKLGLSAIFDIKGDASAASKRISHLGLALPSGRTILQPKRMDNTFVGLEKIIGC